MGGPFCVPQKKFAEKCKKVFEKFVNTKKVCNFASRNKNNKTQRI